MPEWEHVRSVEAETKPFSEGAFGEIYLCRGVNGAAPAVPLVIKLFKQDSNGNAERGYETIRKLQERLKAKGHERSQARKPLTAMPGLFAAPQFCFEGQLNGKRVLGYVARKLDARLFCSFAEILDSHFPQFRRIDPNLKLQFALDLGECLALLRELNYIHADINPQNLFLSMNDGHAVLIDYDSGVVIDRPEDAPTTFGKEAEPDWLAPEVAEQLGTSGSDLPRVAVDLFTDLWSVAVGIHYFLFDRGPYFYLRVAAPTALREYLNNNKWPDISNKAPNFNEEQRDVYQHYLACFCNTDEGLRRALELTFGDGAQRKARRISYAQWVALLKARVKPVPFHGAQSIPPVPFPVLARVPPIKGAVAAAPGARRPAAPQVMRPHAARYGISPIWKLTIGASCVLLVIFVIGKFEIASKSIDPAVPIVSISPQSQTYRPQQAAQAIPTQQVPEPPVYILQNTVPGTYNVGEEESSSAKPRTAERERSQAETAQTQTQPEKKPVCVTFNDKVICDNDATP
jgi:serine/threonine protein kinase